MKNQKSIFNYLRSLILILILASFPVSAVAADTIASIRIINGVVELLRNGKLPAIKASVGDSLSAGDLVRTKSGAYAEVRYTDGTLLKIAQRSRIDIGEQSGGKGNEFSNARLVRGKVQAIVEPTTGQAAKAKRFEIRTPNAVAGVRGTDFVVTFQRNVTGVLVKRGTVYTYNRLLPDRIVNVTQSTLTTITAGSPPMKARPATKSEIDRIEKDIAPQPERKTGETSAGAASQGQQSQGGSTEPSQGTTSPQTEAGVASSRPASSEVIPTDIPINVSGRVSATLSGASSRSVQPSSPVFNPTSARTTAVITPPPPPPPPPVTTTPPPVTTPPVTSTHTNVSVDVKF